MSDTHTQEQQTKALLVLQRKTMNLLEEINLTLSTPARSTAVWEATQNLVGAYYVYYEPLGKDLSIDTFEGEEYFDRAKTSAILAIEDTML